MKQSLISRLLSWRVIVGIPLVLLVGAVSGINYYVYRQVEKVVCDPWNDRYTEVPPEAKEFDPAIFAYNDSVTIEPSGPTLSYWEYSPASLTRKTESLVGTAIIMQGTGGFTLAGDDDYVRGLAAPLYEHGYRVFMVDLRAQGYSTGKTVSYGCLDVADVSALIDDLDRKERLVGHLLTVGHSYGGAMAIQSAANDDRIEAAVSLSGQKDVSGVAAAAHGVSRIRRPKLYSYVQYAIFDSTWEYAVRGAAKRHGFDINKSSALLAIQSMNTPVLMIHGDKDTIVPLENPETMFNSRPENSKLVIIPGANHRSYLAENAYKEEVLKWLDSLSLLQSSSEAKLETTALEAAKPE